MRLEAKFVRRSAEQIHVYFTVLRRWLRGTAAEERQSLAGELSLSCALPVAEG